MQPIGNTDAALIVAGKSLDVMRTTYADEAGTVAAVELVSTTLWLDDGTDVTATHEVVDCPKPIVMESEHCVA